MKLNKIFSAMAGLALLAGATSCDGEKDLIIISGDLPIKTETLYMVGDATPNGWSIDSPTPFTVSEDDALIFSWEGQLYTGEIKLCLVPGSWDVGFIRPLEHGTAISSSNRIDEKFGMHAGDPDDKWRVTEAGNYRLVFNLRDWTYSTYFLGETAGPEIEPIETDVLYMVGDATPAGWDIGAPYETTKTGAYTFVYEGKLKTGEFKCYMEVGNWDAPAIRPTTGDVTIDSNGVSSEDLMLATGPDNKWNVKEEGMYKVTFDLENWKIAVEYTGEAPYEDPLLSATKLYIVGDATPTGWNIGDPTALQQTGDHQFTYTGALYPGEFKAYLEKGNFDAPRIRPAVDQTEVGKDGIQNGVCLYDADEDTKWKVVERGEYTVTFDLEKLTINVVYKGEVGEEPEPDQPDQPGDEPSDDPLLSLTEMYLIGSATAGGWDWGQAPAMEKVGDTFVWTGTLGTGELKASPLKEYTSGNKYIRPAGDGVTISLAGPSDPTFIYASEDDGPDYKWNVTEAGAYTLTFDLKTKTISVAAAQAKPRRR